MPAGPTPAGDPQTMMAMQLLQQILMGAGSNEPDADDMNLMGDGAVGGSDMPPGAQAAVGPPGIGTQAMPSPAPPPSTVPPSAMPHGPKRPPASVPGGKGPHAPPPKAASRDRAPYKALGNKPKSIKPKPPSKGA